MRNRVIILLSIFMVACIKELPLVQTDFVEPRPVFHMYINPDSAIVATFGQVAGISDPHVEVNSALVSIYRNGVFQGDMTASGKGIYLHGSQPFQPRDSFRIYGSNGVAGFIIRGKIPSRMVVEKTDTQTMLIPGLGPAFTIDLTFTDSAIDDNFYRLSCKRIWYKYKLDQNNKRTDSVLMNGTINLGSSELAVIQNNFNNYTSKELLFSDATFNGVKLKFRFYSKDIIRETQDSRTVSLEVILENMDKKIYEYYNTRNAHLWQQQSITQLPGIVAGNITNGYGVVGGYTTTSKTINIR